GGVADAVGDVDPRHHLPLPVEQALVLRVGVLDAAVGEHLHLVELLAADDAAGVLAVAAGLAAVAGAPAGVAQRAAFQADYLVLGVSGQRRLAGAAEVAVV